MKISATTTTATPPSPGKSQETPPGLARNDRELPPGITKKLERGGELPAGIAKRFAITPEQVVPTTPTAPTAETEASTKGGVDITV